MKNIKKFSTSNEVDDYIQGIALEKIGTGAEGSAYLTNDGDVIKRVKYRERVPYNDDMISSLEFNLESFIFPNEFILENDFVAAYRANYFKGDILSKLGKSKVEIDLEKLLEARERMIKDLDILSAHGYKTLDIENNILFDGNRLVAIDTLDYKKEKGLLPYQNEEILDEGLKSVMRIIEPRFINRNYDLDFMVDEIIENNDDNPKIIVYPKR